MAGYAGRSAKIVQDRLPARHGSFAIGQTLDEAFQWTDALEEAAQIIMYAKYLNEEMIEYRRMSDSYSSW